MDITLKSGDIVVDSTTGDVGLLTRRWSIFEPRDEFYAPYKDFELPDFDIWPWDIYWTGPDNKYTNKGNRTHPYTEEGLLNLIKTGTFVLKNKD